MAGASPAMTKRSAKGSRLRLRRSEGVAGFQLAAVDASLEPGDALGRAAVGEGVRRHGAALLALQAVVANRTGRIDRGLDIALLKAVLGPVGLVGPNSGEAVGLQPDAHRDGVRGPLVAALAGVVGLP